MRLYSRVWERRLRRAVRAETRTVPALWKEYKQRRRRWYHATISSYVFLFLLGISLFLSCYLNERRLVDRLDLPLIFGATAFALWRSNGLLRPLQDKMLNCLLAHYPIERTQAFRQVWQAWLWRGLWVLAVVLAPVGVALLAEQSWKIVLAMVMAQWATMHLAAICLTAVKPQRSHSWLGLLFLGMAILAWLQPPQGAQLLTLLEPGARWLLPSGWALAAAHGHWNWLIPLAGLAAGSRFCWRRFRDDYLAQPDTDTVTPVVTNADEEPAFPSVEPAVTPAELHAIADRTRSALRPVGDEPADVIGRWLWRWFTPAERKIFRFVTNDFRATLTKQWRTSLIIATAGLAIGSCLPAKLASWVIGFTVWTSLVCLGADSQAVDGDGGNGLRRWALYPLRFWNIARTALKTILLQFACWLPVPLVGGAVLAVKWGAPATVGVLFGGKAAALILILLPISIPLQVTSNTNDSRSPHCATRLALLVILTVLLMIGGGVVFLFAPVIPATAGGLVALLASGWVLRCYGRWFNQMRFDLLPVIAQAK